MNDNTGPDAAVNYLERKYNTVQMKIRDVLRFHRLIGK